MTPSPRGGGEGKTALCVVQRILGLNQRSASFQLNFAGRVSLHTLHVDGFTLVKVA